ncbi:MAG: hypothetical protein E7C50_00270 [Clostridium sp.]|uniref:hypothetical protein n=1 Tax=Clostridium sp. TaxID=1506 RepID=UPI002903F67D|nr:hypothetical protein [Clostridium sp.]MDU2674198.1 hypothetical protein [Clostridium sp.]MDU2680293.1 hypothetical protein [Clostridium sp.]
MNNKDILKFLKYVISVIAIVSIIYFVLDNSGSLNLEYKELKIEMSGYKKNTHPAQD